MKMYGGVEVALVISALDRSKLLAALPKPLYFWERNPATHWVGVEKSLSTAENRTP
jgi:hypothetical protein